MESIRDLIQSNLVYLFERSKQPKKEIAEQVGVSGSAISNWLKGANSPDIDTLARLCDYFGVTIREMLEVDLSQGKKITPTPGTESERKALYDSIVGMLSCFDEDKLKRFLDVVKIVNLSDLDFERLMGIVEVLNKSGQQP